MDTAARRAPEATEPGNSRHRFVDIGDRLELFVDRFLIDRLEGAPLVLHRPEPREVVLTFSEPWEAQSAAYVTVIKDGATCRLYYRGTSGDPATDPPADLDVVCYAESRDGVTWTKPGLGLHAFRGSTANNIIMVPGGTAGLTHNFTPFLDQRPGVPAGERLKAIAGSHGSGIFRFASADGIRWRPLSDTPLFPDYALDSQNVPVWLPAEGCYAIYLRTWTGDTPGNRASYQGLRTISRSISRDFLTWTEPEAMSFGDTPAEHLYTNATQPYFRAPHILIALPFRFFPGKSVHDEPTLASWGVHRTQFHGISDAVLMSSRGGLRFDRTFMESFIRPGLNPRAWTARSNIPATGILPTGPSEMSLYVATHYSMPDQHLQRHVLRTDGFASVRAPYSGGELLTRPLAFSGASLRLNYATSAAGEIRVELQDADGRPVPGFTLEDAVPLVGDTLAGEVAWRSDARLATLAGQPVRLRFVMRDADLYSLRFPTA